jgi:hypothetical protein
MCGVCTHKVECGKLMDFRLGKITLDRLRINLMPIGFDVDINYSNEHERIEIIYQDCYSAVFKEPSKQNVGQYAQAITQHANTAGVSLRTYIMTLMVAHKENDLTDRIQFFPASLAKKGKIKTVELYAKICRQKYASFHDSDCDRELELLTGVKIGDSSSYQRMIHSETLAGEFIVGFKKLHDGYPTSILYTRRELALDPLWLATEQSYYSEILSKFIPVPFGTSEQQRHRYSVIRCLQQMKRRKPYAISVFEARTSAVKNVLPTVLSRFGFQTTDLETVDEEVTDSVELWYKIGLCAQHLECLKFTHGQKNALSVNTF